ncbi:Os01g0234433, partial [Oryza sativa Japonica Group]
HGQAGYEGDAGGRQPGVAADEPPDGELHGLLRQLDDAVARPWHAPADRRAGAGVAVLAVVERVRRAPRRVPGEPAGGVDVARYVRHHVHRPRVRLPWPPEVRRRAAAPRRRRELELRRREEAAAVHGDAGALVRVAPPLRRDRVLLPRQRPPRPQRAVLQHHGGVPEHEVHRAGDVAVAVELPLRVRVQRVLVPQHGAPVHHRVVAAQQQRHRLVPRRAGAVLHRHVPHDEPRPGHRCGDDEDRHDTISNVLRRHW